MEIIREVKVGAKTVQLCKDAAGEYRTRVTAANGEVLFPPEGYKNSGDAVENLRQLRDVLADTDLSKLIK
jgi:uncharacterized protein YegP (UPF0339 family)